MRAPAYRDAGLRVSGLHIYPIKSCAGLALEWAEVAARGLAHDREFMVINIRGRAVTQRDAPRLALVMPRIVNGTLAVSAPGLEGFCAPIVRQGRPLDAAVWDDTCRAVDQGVGMAEWFSDFLGGQYRVVRMADDAVRDINPDYARCSSWQGRLVEGVVRRIMPHYRRWPHDQVGFADAYACLLISEESLVDLNARLCDPLPMNRFRPNIVIAGGTPYLEDRAASLQIGEVPFRALKPCVRCAITTTDQATGARGDEPLRTLAAYRKTPKGVIFGQYIQHEGRGTLHRGDAVRILAERHDELPKYRIL